VTARPNLRWEISEPKDEFLDGTYMEGQQLFAAALSGKSNRTACTISLKVRQRDLVINQVIRNESALSFFQSLSESQRRLIDIFIAKSLSEATYGNRRYVGEIVLSEAEYQHEE